MSDPNAFLTRENAVEMLETWPRIRPHAEAAYIIYIGPFECNFTVSITLITVQLRNLFINMRTKTIRPASPAFRTPEGRNGSGFNSNPVTGSECLRSVHINPEPFS